MLLLELFTRKLIKDIPTVKMVHLFLSPGKQKKEAYYACDQVICDKATKAQYRGLNGIWAPCSC